MGLIKEGDDHVVLTDIAGVEDHLGDMDFKVAGTADGITALQMDIKISGVTFDILRDALEQARQGRLFILDKMKEAIPGRASSCRSSRRGSSRSRSTPTRSARSSARAARRSGPCRRSSRPTSTSRTTARFRSTRRAAPWSMRASPRIEAMTKEAEVGDRFTGKVVKTTAFGAFVELTKGTDGLLHISNVKPGERVERGRGRAQRRATSSTSPWSRSTASAAASACGSPTIPRSRARRPRS